MNPMTRTFSKALIPAMICSWVLAACADIAGEDIALKVDRSNTLDFALARPAQPISLEGLWNTVWPKLQLSRDATGRYTGRLMEPNVRCGYDRGEEVLRGHLDSDGVFSGEVLVCAASQCPGVAARWIYFMALVDRDGSRFVGAIAPTAHEGCNALFRGMPLSGLRTKGAVPGSHLTESAVETPRAGELDARATSDEKEADACAVVDPQGHLRMTGAGARDVEIAVDGVSWGRPPFLRPIAAGAHRVTIQRGSEAAIVRTICVPGGKEPVSIDVNAFLRQAEAPSTGRREGAVAEAKPCKRGNKKGLLRITMPTAKATLTIDGKAQNTRGKKVVTRELLIGEHTVVLSRPGASKETRTVCVHEGRTPVHVNFSSP